MKKNTMIKLILISIVFIAGLYFFINSDNKNKAEIIPPVEDVVQEPDKGETEPPKSENVANPGDIAVDAPAPDFTLKDLSGNEVSLSDYKGKIVFLNFWATWCKYCDIEMPDLNKVHKDNDDVVVLAVNVMEEQKTVEPYITKGGYEFDVVLDTDGEISRNYLIRPLPTTYFIDAEGILLGRLEGMLEYEQMVSIIDDIRTR